VVDVPDAVGRQELANAHREQRVHRPLDIDTFDLHAAPVDGATEVRRITRFIVDVGAVRVGRAVRCVVEAHLTHGAHVLTQVLRQVQVEVSHEELRVRLRGLAPGIVLAHRIEREVHVREAEHLEIGVHAGRIATEAELLQLLGRERTFAAAC